MSLGQPGDGPANGRRGVRASRTPSGTPWPRVYQAMRVTCENGWKLDGFSEPTYTAWIGHSPAVSRKHYVSPTDAEFAAVVEAV